MKLVNLCFLTMLMVNAQPQQLNVIKPSTFSNSLRSEDAYLFHLSKLLAEILVKVHLKHCFVIITDNVHHSLYDQEFFRQSRAQERLCYFIKVDENEDLLAPNYQTVRVLKQIRTFNCDMHLITLINGLQTKRFLQLIHKHRLLNTKQKFVLLHDARILEVDMLHIWSNMISTVFIKRHLDNRYSISTISYAAILNGFVVTKHLTDWMWTKRARSVRLFSDQSSNLNGADLPVVVFVHVPMVRRDTVGRNKTFTGLEIEILKALGKALNFKPQFYETGDSETERWGRQLRNGSFSGLIGHVINRTARIAIGDLHLYTLYTAVMDFSWPHSHECLTFLTPESSKDNSWKTLIQPFSGGMWTGVLLSLFVVGTVFYTISFAHALLLRRQQSSCGFFGLLRKKRLSAVGGRAVSFDSRTFRDARFRAYLSRLQQPTQPHDEDLFDNFHNCILLTYSMLMYVSLPRMPRNWPLRVLTGWYWLYCILLTVTYRASFTAILANPAARITIDSLDDLVSSRITAATWKKENKKFFDDAFDEVAQEIGQSMEIIEDIHEVTDRIIKGNYAYYDNEYFLSYLRFKGNKRSVGDEVLHIMRDCVVHMPVAIGLEKNSPLKPHIDKYLQRLSESGLVAKWLKDAVKDLVVEEQAPQEALMDLRKFWSSFIALAIGYFLAICAIAAENLHFKHIVRKHPLYDEYNPSLYWNFKSRYQ